MWKESYRIGVDGIDEQHRELFSRVALLHEAIERNEDRKTFEETIAFLNSYVLIHFREEEAYQESIGYPGREQHKVIHQRFTDKVQDFERRLAATNFDIQVVKELAGMLSSWLIYHVVCTDWKLVNGDDRTSDEESLPSVHVVTQSVLSTYQAMAGFDRNRIISTDETGDLWSGDLAITIGLTGDLIGSLTFAYSEDFALNLMETILLTRPASIDEVVCSALAEIANIAMGSAASAFSRRGLLCNITVPQIQHSPKESLPDGIVYHTEIGKLKLTVNLEQLITA